MLASVASQWIVDNPIPGNAVSKQTSRGLATPTHPFWGAGPKYGSRRGLSTVVVKTVLPRPAGRYAAGTELMQASTSLTAVDFQLSVAQGAQARRPRLRYTL